MEKRTIAKAYVIPCEGESPLIGLHGLMRCFLKSHLYFRKTYRRDRKNLKIDDTESRRSAYYK